MTVSEPNSDNERSLKLSLRADPDTVEPILKVGHEVIPAARVEHELIRGGPDNAITIATRFRETHCGNSPRMASADRKAVSGLRFG
jgi:hypothetical protein